MLCEVSGEVLLVLVEGSEGTRDDCVHQLPHSGLHDAVGLEGDLCVCVFLVFS